MNIKIQIPVVIAAVLLMAAACQSPKEKSLQDIEALQVQDTVFSVENMAKLKDAYLAFADKYPDDERTPEFLFKAAQSCSVLASQHASADQHKEAVKIFERLRTNYPKHELAEESMFLTGYIYENHLGDTTRNKRIYQDFIVT